MEGNNSASFEDVDSDDDEDDLIIDSVPTSELPDVEEEGDHHDHDTSLDLVEDDGSSSQQQQQQELSLGNYKQTATANDNNNNNNTAADCIPPQYSYHHQTNNAHPHSQNQTVESHHHHLYTQSQQQQNPQQNNPQQNLEQTTTTTTTVAAVAADVGLLERYGQWLMSIPRDDVLALQQTPEYHKFCESFELLGKAHRRTVILNRRNIMEYEEEDYHDVAASSSSSSSSPPEAETDTTMLSSPSPAPPPLLPVNKQIFRTTSLGPYRKQKKYSFLQHLAVDDVILRVFEFLDCTSLARTSATCHRFHQLSLKSAKQRTQNMCKSRLLCSAMKLLRAKEQIEGVGPRHGPFVPVPMLGLSKRVEVTNAGDVEYNGIYFCTGSNGNGFLFTKPRMPERRVGEDLIMGVGVAVGGVHHHHHRMGVGVVGGGIDGGGGGGVLGGNNGVGAAGAVGLAGANVHNVGGGGGGGVVGDDVAMEGEEVLRGRLLRCVIAKRFSNETILWYMSKEVEDSTTHEITQVFSFWAKLMVIGDATPDICRYPSQTSILSRNGDPAWQPLSSTRSTNPPTVELLDD